MTHRPYLSFFITLGALAIGGVICGPMAQAEETLEPFDPITLVGTYRLKGERRYPDGTSKPFHSVLKLKGTGKVNRPLRALRIVEFKDGTRQRYRGVVDVKTPVEGDPIWELGIRFKALGSRIPKKGLSKAVGEGLDGKEGSPTLGPAAGRATQKVHYLIGYQQIIGTFPGGRETGQLRPESISPKGKGRVRIAVSVDWEGRDVSEGAISAMEEFREALPDVPLTHFLNAAYFTKKNADAKAITQRIRRVVLPGDETGLHIHSWYSLVNAAGVTFRRDPSYWGMSAPPPPYSFDLGHDIEICAYEVDELRAIVRKSKSILKAVGLSPSGSFRAGGWLAEPNVLEAIRAEGFTVDSSSTDHTWHDELAGRPLGRRVREVWPDIKENTAPFIIETPAGPILEMPDTGALADYVTAQEMTSHILLAVGEVRKNPDRDVYRHIGFHQETADRYAGRIVEAILKLRSTEGLPIHFETLEESAARVRKQGLEKNPASKENDEK